MKKFNMLSSSLFSDSSGIFFVFKKYNDLKFQYAFILNMHLYCLIILKIGVTYLKHSLGNKIVQELNRDVNKAIN